MKQLEAIGSKQDTNVYHHYAHTYTHTRAHTHTHTQHTHTHTHTRTHTHTTHINNGTQSYLFFTGDDNGDNMSLSSADKFP